MTFYIERVQLYRLGLVLGDQSETISDVELYSSDPTIRRNVQIKVPVR